MKTLIALIFAGLSVTLISAYGGEGSNRNMQSRFSVCPDTPNCVSSRSRPGRNHIDPIDYTGTLESARLRLLEVITDTGVIDRVD
ncbi:MAG TPA: hypothetical protein PLZ16_02585, partial [Gammaproteobacteria bacterium]|nr:hypothetical protein [Gammaproteobacteria bacterium]